MDENICITFYVLLYVKGFLLGEHHKSDCVYAPHWEIHCLWWYCFPIERPLVESMLLNITLKKIYICREMYRLCFQGCISISITDWQRFQKSLDSPFYMHLVGSTCARYFQCFILAFAVSSIQRILWDIFMSDLHTLFNPSVEISVNMTCPDIPGHPTKLHINKTWKQFNCSLSIAI